MAPHVSYTVDKDCVEALRDHIVQDYFRLLLSKGHHNREWVAPYRELLEKNRTGNRRVSYEAPYEKLLKIGESDFSVSDMDVSIIRNILSYDENRDRLHLPRPSFPVRAYLMTIVEDRNVIKAHSSSNEQRFDLLLGSLVMLEHLHRFVVAVSKDEDTLTADQRESYRAMWDAQALELMNDVRTQFEAHEIDRAMDKVIEEDVSWAMTQQDPQSAFEKLDEEYCSRWRGSIDSLYVLLRFRRAASDAGSYWTSLFLGDTYFGGDELLSIERDHQLAGIYYIRAMRKVPQNRMIPPDAKLKLASILINGLCEGYSSESGRGILAAVEEELPSTLRIASYDVSGFTFYRCEPVPLSPEELARKEAQRQERDRRNAEAIEHFNAELGQIRRETSG